MDIGEFRRELYVEPEQVPTEVPDDVPGDVPEPVPVGGGAR
jgi:hypothetical protein